MDSMIACGVIAEVISIFCFGWWTLRMMYVYRRGYMNVRKELTSTEVFESHEIICSMRFPLVGAINEASFIKRTAGLVDKAMGDAFKVG